MATCAAPAINTAQAKAYARLTGSRPTKGNTASMVTIRIRFSRQGAKAEVAKCLKELSTAIDSAARQINST